MALTQTEIASHLDLSQAEVSKFLHSAGIDWKESSLDDIRVRYIRRLRGNAAGHKTDDGADLVHERVLTERVDRELKLYTLAEKKKSLVNVEQLEAELQQMVGAFKVELLGRDDKLKAELDTAHGIDVDVGLLNEHTYAALSHLARYDAGESPAGVAPGTDPAATGTDRTD
jgi:hypothetical protein